MKTVLFMLAMVAHIIFEANDRREAFEIRRISKAKVDSSWKNLTDTAELELPRNVKLPRLRNGQPSDLKQWLRTGDLLTIKLGYNQSYYEEFTGFITEVEADIPIRIKCEDYMWKLKQYQAKFASKNANIKDIITAIIPKELKLSIDAVDATIGSFRTKKGETVAQVLSRLKDIGIYSYFKGKTLVAGKIYTDDSEVVSYNFSQNIISNRLKYRVADDLRIQVTATSTLTNGNKLRVTVGDLDGQEQRLAYFNVTKESDLRVMALADLERLKIDGYEGTFETFGEPFIAHGQKCELIDYDYPERAGKYYVEGVVTTFSESGYRRSIKLDKSE